MFLHFIHQYAYFFSLVFFILPITLFIDSRINFLVLRKIFSKQGLFFLILTIAFWSTYDVLWIKELGSFPGDRILFTIFGVPIEEMLLFALGFYNLNATFAWARRKFGK